MNEKAAETAEEATDLISWILNHGKVQSILNEMQVEVFRKVLTFLVANLTCWGTHFYALNRLWDLKDPLCHVVISRREEIIFAQVGAKGIARRNRSWRMMQLHIVISLMMEHFGISSRLWLMTLNLFASE